MTPCTWTDDDTDFLVEWYECLRKDRFDTFQSADERALEVMAERPVRNNGMITVLHAYECSHCGGFHYGKPRHEITKKSTNRIAREAKKLWKHYEDKGNERVFAKINRDSFQRSL